MIQDLRFLEIEHKFVVGPGYDPQPLLEALRQFTPEKIIQTEVQDTYFLVELAPQLIYRHRLDHMLQQLTVKNLAGNPEVRLEVNLDLNLKSGNQMEAVQAFLAPLNILWQGTIHKTVEAFYFADAELVFYEARFGSRIICCIEVEARQANSIEEAQAVLARWERKIGLDAEQRSLASLLELLVAPFLPDELQNRILAARS